MLVVRVDRLRLAIGQEVFAQVMQCVLLLRYTSDHLLVVSFAHLDIEDLLLVMVILYFSEGDD